MVDEIVVMMAPGYLDEVRAIVRDGRLHQGHADPRRRRAPATTPRRAALAALGEEECNVLLHDAVRPLVSQTIIAANVEALQTYEAVDTAIPSADTVIEVDRRGRQRSPTCSPGICCAAARRRSRSGSRRSARRTRRPRRIPSFTATDDCTVVLRYLPEVPIAVVPGHERNMKVTEPIDVYIADKLFQLTSRRPPRRRCPTSEYRARLEGRTVVVFGGSYGIGGDIAELARAYGADGEDLLPLDHRHPRRAARRHRRRGRQRCSPRRAGSTSW